MYFPAAQDGKPFLATAHNFFTLTNTIGLSSYDPFPPRLASSSSLIRILLKTAFD